MSNELPLSDAAPDYVHPPWSWARIVSNVVSPPVVWAVLSFPLSTYAEADLNRALLWAAIYTLLVCVLPIAFIAYRVQSGAITDIHIRVRRQRIVPYVVTIVMAGLATLVLWALGAPLLVTMFAFFSMLMIVIMLIITTRWQISMHALGITSAVVAIGGLFGLAAGVLFSPLIVLVGAARITLRRHTVAQVIAGGLVGALMTLLLLVVVPH